VIDWFTSYLSGCTQHVRSRTTISSPAVVMRGSSRIGSGPHTLSALFRRSAAADRTSSALRTRLCRRHPDLRILSAERRCLPVLQAYCSLLVKCRRGSAPIGCSSTLPRLKSFGALPAAISIRFRSRHFGSAPLQFCRFSPSGISASTSTLPLL